MKRKTRCHFFVAYEIFFAARWIITSIETAKCAPYLLTYETKQSMSRRNKDENSIEVFVKTFLEGHTRQSRVGSYLTQNIPEIVE